MCQPNLRDPYEGVMGHRFSHVACGLDYTMAIDQNGQVLAWGTPAMIEVSNYVFLILGDNNFFLVYDAT